MLDTSNYVIIGSKYLKRGNYESHKLWKNIPKSCEKKAQVYLWHVSIINKIWKDI